LSSHEALQSAIQYEYVHQMNKKIHFHYVQLDFIKEKAPLAANTNIITCKILVLISKNSLPLANYIAHTSMPHAATLNSVYIIQHITNSVEIV
jgi:hypothetical protein